MGPEASYITKYAPYYIPILAAIGLIIFTKIYLFRDMVSTKMYKQQLDREKEFIVATEKVASRFEVFIKLLETLTKKFSEEIKEVQIGIKEDLTGVNERVRTLELVFSDNIDAIRELSTNCEKHRKGIPETTEFRKDRA